MAVAVSKVVIVVAVVVVTVEILVAVIKVIIAALVCGGVIVVVKLRRGGRAITSLFCLLRQFVTIHNLTVTTRYVCTVLSQNKPRGGRVEQ